MYKLVTAFGPYLIAFMVVGGGMFLLGYLVLYLRLRPYVLILCLFALYIPLVKELMIGFGSGLNPTTFFTGVLAIMWLMQSTDQRIRTPIKGLLVLWIIINCLSLLTTGWAEGGSYLAENFRLLKRAIDPILLFFFVLAIRQKKEFLGLIITVCVGTVIVGAHAYVQGISEGGRITGLLAHPNLTMAFLSAYAPLILAMAMSVKSILWRLAFFFGLYLVLMGLFETGSRMGLLATAIALVAVFLISGNRLVALAGLGAALVLIMLPQLMPERIYKRFEGMLGGDYRSDRALQIDETNPDANVGSRVAIWRGGLNIIRQRPLTGTGFGTFNDEIGPYLFDFYGEERGRSAHNAYIKTAAELGVPALIVLLSVFLIGLKQARYVFVSHPDPQIKWLARGAFGMTLALLVSNFTTASYQDTENMAYFYILTGIVAVLRTQIMAEAEPAVVDR